MIKRKRGCSRNFYNNLASRFERTPWPDQPLGVKQVQNLDIVPPGYALLAYAGAREALTDRVRCSQRGWLFWLDRSDICYITRLGCFAARSTSISYALLLSSATHTNDKEKIDEEQDAR